MLFHIGVLIFEYSCISQTYPCREQNYCDLATVTPSFLNLRKNEKNTVKTPEKSQSLVLNGKWRDRTIYHFPVNHIYHPGTIDPKFALAIMKTYLFSESDFLYFLRQLNTTTCKTMLPGWISLRRT